MDFTLIAPAATLRCAAVDRTEDGTGEWQQQEEQHWQRGPGSEVRHHGEVAYEHGSHWHQPGQQDWDDANHHAKGYHYSEGYSEYGKRSRPCAGERGDDRGSDYRGQHAADDANGTLCAEHDAAATFRASREAAWVDHDALSARRGPDNAEERRHDWDELEPVEARPHQQRHHHHLAAATDGPPSSPESGEVAEEEGDLPTPSPVQSPAKRQRTDGGEKGNSLASQ